MHRGRKFPQDVNHWTCPDYGIQNFAPLRARMQISVIDMFGTFHTVLVTSEHIVVDAHTGQCAWDFLDIAWGPYTGWGGRVIQDQVGEPSTRKYVYQFASGIWRLDGHYDYFGRWPITAGIYWMPQSGASFVFPTTDLSVGPIVSFASVQLGGVPYY